MERGYTYVIVDLRGTGGSDGCNDWGGPASRPTSRDAVEWAARQPWSNGRVGLYGKSYDGWTGLMALAQRPEGLAAVVSQEPVVDGYRYLYMNRVPFSNRLGTPAQFQVIDAQPGHPLDDPMYHYSSLPKDPACYEANVNDQQNPDPNSDFWKPRNLVDAVEGRDDADVHDGRLPRGQHEARPRLGAVEQPRGHGEPRVVRAVGPRPRHRPRARRRRRGVLRAAARRPRGLRRGGRPVPRPPRQGPCRPRRRRRTSTRRSSCSPTTAASARSRRGRPPTSQRLRTDLLGGTYTDDGGNNGTGEAPATACGPSRRRSRSTAHLAGRAHARARADHERAGRQPRRRRLRRRRPTARRRSSARGAYLVPDSGDHAFELYAEDWRFEAGHRIGVLLTDSNAEWFDHAASDAEVEIVSASIELPFLPAPRANDLDGKRSLKLRSYLEEAPFQVPAGDDHRAPGGVRGPARASPRRRRRGRRRRQRRRQRRTDRRRHPRRAAPRPPGRARLAADRPRHDRRNCASRDRPLPRPQAAPWRAPHRGEGTGALRLPRRPSGCAGGRIVRVRRTTAAADRFKVTFRVRRGGRFRAVAVVRDGAERILRRAAPLRVLRSTGSAQVNFWRCTADHSEGERSRPPSAGRDPAPRRLARAAPAHGRLVWPHVLGCSSSRSPRIRAAARAARRLADRGARARRRPRAPAPRARRRGRARPAHLLGAARPPLGRRASRRTSTSS